MRSRPCLLSSSKSLLVSLGTESGRGGGSGGKLCHEGRWGESEGLLQTEEVGQGTLCGVGSLQKRERTGFT